MPTADLHIPAGINFECTGCGNCCLSWPVPITAEDHERIRALESQVESANEAGVSSYFRPLSSNLEKLKGFTHTLEKRQDGRCTFLTEENRCSIHARFGAEAKPSMCRLFPYTFTKTPAGVYASVSFASSGVLFNSGTPLDQQRQALTEKFALFESLFRSIDLDWSRMQLIDGEKLDWQRYAEIEAQLLKSLDIDGPDKLKGDTLPRLRDGSQSITENLPKHTELDRNFTEVSPKLVDQILVKTLLKFYFPDDVFGESKYDLPARSLAAALVTAPPKVTIEVPGGAISFQQIAEFRLGSLGEECESLLRRFIFCRIFSKLYFGPGFQSLSLVSGFHHLAVVVLLLRIKIKCILVERRQTLPPRKGRIRHAAAPEAKLPIDFVEFAELVRTLERRLTDAQFSNESIAILEVLLRSPARLERILYLAS